MVLAAWAQDDPAARLTVELERLQMDMKKMAAERATTLAVGGAVMGPAVKGAPYSGAEITESTQMLGDGNRIHNESQTTVYRDSEGRVRRETPNEITIWDPVANTSYLLDPKAQTARRMPLGKAVYSFNAGKPGPGTTQLTLGPGATHVMEGPGGFVVTSSDAPPPPPAAAGAKMVVRAAVAGRGGIAYGFQTGEPESLGQQVIEGVKADGTRMTNTLPAGAIGNDREIQTTSENWYSTELQTLVKSTHSDPRTGEETFRLTNISRVEPAPYLFQIPAGYQIVDRK
jgi:hypothetical protein